MTKKRIVTLMMAMLLLISTIVVSLVSCTSNEVEDENTTVSANDNVNENEEEKVYSMPKLMSFSAAALERSATGSIDVNVSATVLPVDAQVDKSVDWTVKWADSTKTEPVSDYLTVTPTSDGSANAKISCFKAFDGDIIITDPCYIMKKRDYSSAPKWSDYMSYSNIKNQISDKPERANIFNR